MSKELTSETLDEMKSLVSNLGDDIKTKQKETDKAYAALREELEGVKGQTDGLTSEKIDRIAEDLANSEEKRQEAQLKYDKNMEDMEKSVQKLQASVARRGLSGSEDNGDGYKHAIEFKRMMHSLESNARDTRRFSTDDVDVEEYRAFEKAFEMGLRYDKDRLSDAERKSLNSVSDNDGGYYVPIAMSNRILDRPYETSPMRAVATVETIGAKAIDYPYDYEDASAGWVGELGSRTATDGGGSKKVTITAQEVYAKLQVSQGLLDDASFDIEGWLSRKIADKFARVENTAFVTGDGVEKPHGILDYAAGTGFGQIEQVAASTGSGVSAGEVSFDGLVDVKYSLKENYMGNATWMLNRSTFKEVVKLKDTQGAPIYLPAIAGGPAATILGDRYFLATDVPVPASGSLSFIYGDFARGYTIIDRKDLTILRDPFSAKPLVEFYSTKRVGGAVTDFDALKIGKLSTS